MENQFEKASRIKLRFRVINGLVATEDLWDMSLESLDTLAKSLNKAIKEASEESFIKTKTKATTELEVGFEIVKHIIEVKLEEADARKTLAEKKKRKQLILETINNKKNEALSAKSIEELEKELEDL